MNNGSERYRLRSANFIQGAMKPEQLPEHNNLEFALLGKSNVGKSTFLNRLCNQKNLARVSGTPGRTQEMNLFSVSLKENDKIIDLYLCDLPGYGYAKIPMAKKRQLEYVIYDYITKREQLKTILFLLDARRIPEGPEQTLRNIIFESGKHILPVITKSDKLSKNQLIAQREVIAKTLYLEPDDISLSGTSMSVQPIWENLIEPWQ